MSLLAASLYLLCLAFLFGSALFVFSRDPFDRLNASYAALSLTLLLWVGTLFLFAAQPEGAALLWLGHANFAAAALAAPAAFLFTAALARRAVISSRAHWGAALAVAFVSLLTGWVDAAESVVSGVHVTKYGPLFPLYVLFILGYLVAVLRTAFYPGAALRFRIRLQLRLVGAGVLAVALVGAVTNAALPYFLGDFRFIHLGALSTICFLAAVAYAACFHGLFSVRVALRAALVASTLVALTLELYTLAVGALAQLLPFGDPAQRHLAAAGVALTVNAFTAAPLRAWLERLADRLLVGPRGGHGTAGGNAPRNPSGRGIAR